MGEVSVRWIQAENASDINIPNEPFEIWGRMLPSYGDGRWSYAIRKADQTEWDVFPEEKYDFESMREAYVFLGAYDGANCIGLAILKRHWNRYIYLHDLKVQRAYRRRHVATQMMQEACRYAGEHGYRGVFTIAQDNNLSACLFYLHAGFRIGGLDTEAYAGTKLEGNADIFFYKDIV